MQTWRRHLFSISAVLALGIIAARARAHGFVGDRLFPATLATDDPLAADELSLPALSFFEFPGGGGDPETRVQSAGFEFDKVVFPKLAIGVSDDHLWMQPRGGTRSDGWDNLTLSIKYELWRDEPHEAIISVGLESELGGTGSKGIGRESFSTFTPTFYFGKGFGDLPDAMALFKPFAVTGTLGLDLPTEAANPNSLEWGLAVEYNIPYLQQHVKDFGIPEPFKNMIPLVEFAMDSPFNRGQGATTGTINPGVLWESRYFQVGVEAMIPINRESGDHVGALVEFQIYIDDLFPKLFGHPIFGE